MARKFTAKQRAAQRLFAERARAGAFKRKKSTINNPSTKKTAPKHASFGSLKEAFRTVSGKPATRSRKSREWYATMHQKHPGARQVRPSIWVDAHGDIMALPYTLSRGRMLSNPSRKRKTKHNPSSKRKTKHNPSRKRRTYNRNPFNAKSILKSSVLINGVISLGSIFAGVQIESFLIKQSWFPSTMHKYAGGVNLAAGVLLAMKAKNPKVKSAGAGLVGAGLWSLLYQNVESLHNVLPAFPAGDAATTGTAPAPLVSGLGRQMPWAENRGFAHNPQYPAMGADARLAADASLGADARLAGASLQSVPSMRSDLRLSGYLPFGKMLHGDSDGYDQI